MYKSKVNNSSPQYSKKYIDFIHKEIKNNPKFIEECRQNYKKHLKDKKSSDI